MSGSGPDLGLSTTSFAVLGLVAIRPASGYDLTAFADRSIAHFWPIARSRIYRELNRLEGLGLITGTVVAQDSAPDKTVYRITQRGREALRDWVELPEIPSSENRNGLLLKVFMTRHASSESLRTALNAFRERLELELADLQSIVADLAGKDSASFGRLTARFGVLHIEASLAWLDEAERLIAAGPAATGPDAATVSRSSSQRLT